MCGTKHSPTLPDWYGFETYIIGEEWLEDFKDTLDRVFGSPDAVRCDVVKTYGTSPSITQLRLSAEGETADELRQALSLGGVLDDWIANMQRHWARTIIDIRST